MCLINKKWNFFELRQIFVDFLVFETKLSIFKTMSQAPAQQQEQSSQQQEKSSQQQPFSQASETGISDEEMLILAAESIRDGGKTDEKVDQWALQKWWTALQKVTGAAASEEDRKEATALQDLLDGIQKRCTRNGDALLNLNPPSAYTLASPPEVAPPCAASPPIEAQTATRLVQTGK